MFGWMIDSFRLIEWLIMFDWLCLIEWLIDCLISTLCSSHSFSIRTSLAASTCSIVTRAHSVTAVYGANSHSTAYSLHTAPLHSVWTPGYSTPLILWAIRRRWNTAYDSCFSYLMFICSASLLFPVSTADGLKNRLWSVQALLNLTITFSVSLTSAWTLWNVRYHFTSNRRRSLSSILL